jgi:hypothetical protein
LKQAVEKIEMVHIPRGEGHYGSFPHWAVMAGDGSKRKGKHVVELPYLDAIQHRAFPKVP